MLHKIPENVRVMLSGIPSSKDQEIMTKDFYRWQYLTSLPAVTIQKLLSDCLQSLKDHLESNDSSNLVIYPIEGAIRSEPDCTVFHLKVNFDLDSTDVTVLNREVNSPDGLSGYTYQATQYKISVDDMCKLITLLDVVHRYNHSKEKEPIETKNDSKYVIDGIDMTGLQLRDDPPGKLWWFIHISCIVLTLSVFILLLVNTWPK